MRRNFKQKNVMIIPEFKTNLSGSDENGTVHMGFESIVIGCQI